MGRLFLRLLLIIIGVIATFFFPFYIQMDAHYDVNRKKLGFSASLFGFIKLVGGYIGTYKGGISLHLTKKRAVLVAYNKINSERKRFSFMKTFRLVSLKQTVETGAEYLFLSTIVQTTIKAIFVARRGKKEAFYSNLWLNDGDLLRISVNAVLYFNLFILIKNFIKFIKEKLAILWQKKTKKSTV